MKFSMIVPLYHGEKYVSDIITMAEENKKQLSTLDSLELIFVNDSPESPLPKELVTTGHIPVTVIENSKNVGIHASRIFGIQAAQGEYILLLDQDDRIAADYFKSQISYIAQRADVIVANGFVEGENQNKLLYRWHVMQQTVQCPLFYALFDCRIISPGQCLIRKECIPLEWMEHPLSHNGADDLLLWLMLLSRKAVFKTNRKPIYRHCYTAQNVSLNVTRMMDSVEEAMAVAQSTRSVKPYIIKIMKERVFYQKGKNHSLFWAFIFHVRAYGEKINRN